MKKNKIITGALALAMGLGAVAPVAQSFAAEDNKPANEQPKEAALDLSKVLLSARKLAKAELTEEDKKTVEAYNLLAPEKKAEVKKAVENALGENYELNGTDLKLKEGKTDEKPTDFVEAFVGAVKKAVNDAKAEKPAEEVKEDSETGFSTEEAAEKAAKEAVDKDPVNDSYKVDKGNDGKFYYTLFVKVDEEPSEDDTQETPQEDENVKGYDSEEDAKKAAEEALKKDEVNKSYNVSKGLDGKWYFSLSTEESKEDPDKKPQEDPDKKPGDKDPDKKPQEKDQDDDLKGLNLKAAKEKAFFEFDRTPYYVFDSKTELDIFRERVNKAETVEEVNKIVEEYRSVVDSVEKYREAREKGRDEIRELKNLSMNEADGFVNRLFFKSKTVEDVENVLKEARKLNEENKKKSNNNNGNQGSTGSSKNNINTGSTKRVTRKAVDKEKLNKAIVDAEILIKDEKGTEVQRDRLQIAIDNARKSRDKADVTQSELDAQEKSIRDIMNEILGIKTEAHEQKEAKGNVKTGVAGVAGVAGVLALAAAGYAVTNKRK